eukprot:TRINITY_DN3237_c1_g1_i2.p1 TRINITY_DN3237_c1_g1~~TRINITY_DN3237_c1_g1_i2.p1  ORF type:complete len:186 (+),score=-22.38 TRINITY_DN3237_c1_g1_i2:501-1058(+)
MQILVQYTTRHFFLNLTFYFSYFQLTIKYFIFFIYNYQFIQSLLICQKTSENNLINCFDQQVFSYHFIISSVNNYYYYYYLMQKNVKTNLTKHSLVLSTNNVNINISSLFSISRIIYYFLQLIKRKKNWRKKNNNLNLSIQQQQNIENQLKHQLNSDCSDLITQCILVYFSKYHLQIKIYYLLFC